MPDGFRIDDLTALSEPTVATDRMFVGRSGELYRRDVSGMRGGWAKRTTTRPVVKPVTSDFNTWLNQGSAVLTDVGDALSLTTVTSGTDNLRGRSRSLPAGNWDVTVGMSRHWRVRNFLYAGIFLRESATGKLETLMFGDRANGGTISSKWTSATAFSAHRQARSDYHDRLWLRFRKTGLLFQPMYSRDGSIWAQLDVQLALNSFFTTAPDQWGYFVYANGASIRADVFHWDEATNTDYTSYFGILKNADGQGDRSSRITVTTDLTLTTGTIPLLVDGTTGTNQIVLTASQTLKQITFQFSEAKIVTAGLLIQSQANGGGFNHGTWKWQGSNNGSSWTDLTSTFLLDGSTTGFAQGDLSANATAYLYYRLQQTAGVTRNDNALREMEFKLRKG